MGHNVKFHCLNLPGLTPSAGYITERNILRASGSFSWNDNTRYGSGLHYIQILLCVSLWHQLNLEATYDISLCHIIMTCYVAPYRYTDIQIYRYTDIQMYRRYTRPPHTPFHLISTWSPYRENREPCTALLATNISRWDKDFSWNL